MVDSINGSASVAQTSTDADSAILSSERDRRKRRQKFGTACYPCRQRKVKCTYEVPCAKCVERDHAELCVYEQQPKRVNIERPTSEEHGTSTYGSPGTVPKADWDRLCRKVDGLERVITELRDVLREAIPSSASNSRSRALKVPHSRETDCIEDDPHAPGILTGDDVTGATVHIGASSVPAMVMAMSEGADNSIKELASKGMLPLFALDNEGATYPFVDLWGLPHGSSMRLQELAKLIPSDSECLELIRNFRDNFNVLFPVVANIQQFEMDVTDFLISRSTFVGELQQGARDFFGKSLHWIGLLFAVLAGGCQCSERDRKERQLTCQVYVCCAYECLRHVNYLARASLTDVQTLLILCTILSNTMNAGVAWALVGLTTRLAQSIGLNHDPPDNLSHDLKYLRENVW